MNKRITLKPPTGADCEVIDPDNPPLTEEMLGPPIYRYGNDGYKSMSEFLKAHPELDPRARSQGKPPARSRRRR